VLRRSLEPGQYLCVAYSDRLAANSIVASVGSKGDSYDNALTESFNGLYKWELIYRRGPWAGLEDVEFATLEYVDWFNDRRLHGQIAPGPGYTTPAAFEEEYDRTTVLAEGVGTQTDESL
jgi:transposase InsO family protein